MAQEVAGKIVSQMMATTPTLAIAASPPRASASTVLTAEIIATNPRAQAATGLPARLEKSRHSARMGRAVPVPTDRLPSRFTAFPRFKAGS